MQGTYGVIWLTDKRLHRNGMIKNFINAALPNKSKIESFLVESYLTSLKNRFPGDSEEKTISRLFRFFFPQFTFLRSPFRIPNIDKAVSILKLAYEAEVKPKITIFADRDVDGITAASILSSYLTQAMSYPSEKIITLVPKEDEKYGIEEKALDRILKTKPQILIALDLGSSNKESFLEISKTIKCQAIILDHHFVPEKESDYPKVDAFVNPKLAGEKFFEYDLCSAGMVFKLIHALTLSFTSEYNRPILIKFHTEEVTLCNGIKTNLLPKEELNLNSKEWKRFWEKTQQTNFQFSRFATTFSRADAPLLLEDAYLILKNLSLLNVKSRILPWIGLAAIGTVGDIMPIFDDNRILVKEGISQIKAGNSPIGLLELIRQQKLEHPALNEIDLAFSICPAINAPGRLGNAELALNTLLAKDPLKASELSFHVKATNKKRKDLSKNSINMIIETLDKRSLNAPLAIGYHPNIHRGISGIVASKLAEHLEKPAIVIVNDGDCMRGSARAYEEEDVFSVLQSVDHMFIQYGGHKQAAGFSLAYDRFEEFKEKIFNIKISQKKTETLPNISIKESEINKRTFNSIFSFSPYGKGFPLPLLEISLEGNIAFSNLGKTGEHVKINFSKLTDSTIEGVWFFHNNRVSRWKSETPQIIHAEPHLNYFMGQTRYQLKIKKVDALKNNSAISLK